MVAKVTVCYLFIRLGFLKFWISLELFHWVRIRVCCIPPLPLMKNITNLFGGIYLEITEIHFIGRLA